jgi:hypothetical protein
VYGGDEVYVSVVGGVEVLEGLVRYFRFF